MQRPEEAGAADRVPGAHTARISPINKKHKTLSPAKKAKRLAKKAGRRYPNMVDNARVARER